jgi:hypothetical protein
MIENLLHTLSADRMTYPQGLLENRRTAYLSQVISVVSNGPRSGKRSRGQGRGQGGTSHVVAPMTPVMKAVLTILIAGNIALVSYVGILAYENWDKVQALLFGAPIASETSPPPPELSTQLPNPNTTPEISTAPENTIVPGSTLEPNTSPEEIQPTDGDSGNQPEVSTPEPPSENKPGLHLGQTPHPPAEPPGQDNNNDQVTDPNNGQGNNNKDK